MVLSSGEILGILFHGRVRGELGLREFFIIFKFDGNAGGLEGLEEEAFVLVGLLICGEGSVEALELLLEKCGQIRSVQAELGEVGSIGEVGV